MCIISRVLHSQKYLMIILTYSLLSATLVSGECDIVMRSTSVLRSVVEGVKSIEHHKHIFEINVIVNRLVHKEKTSKMRIKIGPYNFKF